MAKAADELVKVDLGGPGDPRPTFICKNLDEREEELMLAFLKEYRDVFAWTSNEMPVLPHQLESTFSLQSSS